MENVFHGKLTNVWWLFLLRGILMLVFGLLFITAPGLTLATLVLFLGAYWFIHGIFSIIGIFIGTSNLHWGWLLLDGVIGILAGLFVLNHPLLSTILVPTVLVIVLGIQGLIMGIINLIQSFRGDGTRAFIVGAINILFGVILLWQPVAAASILPLVLGVLGIAGGIWLIALSLHIHGIIKHMAVT